MPWRALNGFALLLRRTGEWPNLPLLLESPQSSGKNVAPPFSVLLARRDFFFAEQLRPENDSLFSATSVLRSVRGLLLLPLFVFPDGSESFSRVSASSGTKLRKGNEGPRSLAKDSATASAKRSRGRWNRSRLGVSGLRAACARSGDYAAQFTVRRSFQRSVFRRRSVPSLSPATRQIRTASGSWKLRAVCAGRNRGCAE